MDNIDENIYNEYQKLLQFGPEIISDVYYNDVTDLDEREEIKQLKDLNKYVYPCYSSIGSGDDTESIEFVVLSSYFDAIVEKLKEEGLWFLAINYGSEGQISKNYDENINDQTIKISNIVNDSDLKQYDMKSNEHPNGWEIVKNDENGEITIEKDNFTYFLHTSNIDEIENEYTRQNYFMKRPLISKLAGKIDIDLLSNNVALIMVEDPVVGRKTLNTVLLKIFKEVMPYSSQKTMSAGSRKSKGKAKGSRKSKAKAKGSRKSKAKAKGSRKSKGKVKGSRKSKSIKKIRHV